MTQTCRQFKQLLYILVFAVVFVFIVLSLNIEHPYLEEKRTDIIMQIKSSRNDVVTEHAGARSGLPFKPEHRLRLLCNNVDTYRQSKMTSTQFSRIKLTKFDNDGNILVAIETYDMTDTPKTSGGDVIVIWANETRGKGLVSGQVIDHRNGSYTGILKVFWTGMTHIYAKLASSIENTCLRVKSLNKYGNTIYAMQKPWGIRGLFRTKYMRELTGCGANPKIYGFRNVCNFTSLNGGMSWFCGKPKHHQLQCSDIHSFGTGKYIARKITQREKIQQSGHGVFKEFISLEIQNYREKTLSRNNISCSLRSPLLSWTELEPSGYWLNDKWNFVNCYSDIQHSINTYTKCLKNKNVVIIGDSTLRQYAEYLIEQVLHFGIVHMKDAVGKNRTYHSNKVFTRNGINLLYIKHEMPFHNPDFPVEGILSVPQMLHSIEEKDLKDDSIILVINYNSHFSAYPAESFRDRIRHLVVALDSFLKKKPRAKVFFKGPHLSIDDTRWFDSKISLLYKDILKEEFSKLMNRVTYLDTWSITVAHNSELLHPTGDAFISQIIQLMSYIC